MENMICPNCRKDFGIKSGMSGTDCKSCISCGDAFVVMYVAGFNDGLRAAPAPAGEVVEICDSCRRQVNTLNCAYGITPVDGKCYRHSNPAYHSYHSTANAVPGKEQG